MLQRVARRRTLVLLDFLAPSLISKASTSATTSHTTPLPTSSPVPPVILEKLKKQLIFIHSSNGHGSTAVSQAQLFNDTISKIRQAVAKKDIPAILQAWKHLEDSKLLHFLGASQLGMLSHRMAQTLLPVENEHWDPVNQKVVEAVALLAAVGSSVDALNSCMRVHIKRGNPDAVIKLYQRFMEMAGEEEKETEEDGTVEEEEIKHPASLAFADKARFTTITQPPGRATLLLYITTAHAMRNSFVDALQVCLATPIRFHSYSTQTLLEKLNYDRDLQIRVEIYVRRLNVARLVARPPSLSKHITNLSTSSFKGLQTLYHSIIDGLSGPDAYIAADPSAIAPKKLVSMTEVGWTSFLVAFLKRDRRDLSSQIWNDLAQRGIKPGVSMWTALIDAYDSMRRVDEALATWKMMFAQGIKPDGLTYRAMISTFFNSHKPEDAMRLFQAFRKELLPDCPAHHAVSVYNTVLQGLLRAGHVDEANVVIRSMEVKGPAPDIISYNTFLAHHGRRGDFKALAALVTKMASLKLSGDVFSFSTILSALLKVGREDAPEMMLDIMQKQGVQPNVATYSAIIDHQMREKNEKNLQAAMRMLHSMEQDPNLQPNEVTYTSILAGLYRGHWLPVEKAEEWRLDVVERMKQHGIRFKLPTYHILIKACLEYPHPEGLQSALRYYQEMAESKVPLVNTTWYILLAGLLQRGEWKVADEIVKDMFLTDIRPSGALLELVSRIKRRVRTSQE
jgi:pentatricopeptide repeat protein